MKLKWEKQGLIFDTKNYSFRDEPMIYAQSPQPVVLKDRVRFYFSTRIKDRESNFMSHISYVDFDKALEQIIGINESTIVQLGELGCFDEHGIFPFSPLPSNNGKIMAYTCGWSRRKSVPVSTATGLVISEDGGESFCRLGPGPVMSSSINEPFLVGDSFVRKYGNRFYMWYIYGIKWIELSDHSPSRVYKIAQAESQDGINWERDSVFVIPDVLDVNECQALPTVQYYEGVYHMVFCYRYADDFRNNPLRGYRLGYAFSLDLVNWTRDDSQVQMERDSWDSEMQCYPCIFQLEEEIYMVYNGNEFGKNGFGLAKLKLN